MQPRPRRRSALAAACALAAALGLAACGGDPDPARCCSTAASCAALGEDDTVACADPARPFCDDAGEFGPAGTCIPQPSGGDCDAPADCTDPAFPVCLDQTCVECATSDDCTDPEAPSCDPDTFTCGACTANTDCAAPTAVCDTDAGACVQCLDAADCADPAAPICGDDQACRGCIADAECASTVCDEPAAACVDASRVLYVAVGGAGSDCTQAAPCDTLAEALALVTTSRDVIKVAPGSYSEKLVVNALTVTITGEGVNLTPPPSMLAGPLASVTGGSNLTLDGLTLSGAATAGAMFGDGINCVASTITLRGVEVRENARNGILGTDCTLTVEASTISANTGGGISANNGTLTVEASTISANTGGGISLSFVPTFSIRNSFITRNGGLFSTIGGVLISSPGAGTAVIDFVTVTENTKTNGLAAGISCLGVLPTSPVAISNSLSFGNGNPTSLAQVDGDNCNAAYTLTGPGTTALPGTNNLTGDPMFVDPTNGDFHLLPGSPAIDAADPAATLATDIDGDARPQGDRRDLGADEVTP